MSANQFINMTFTDAVELLWPRIQGKDGQDIIKAWSNLALVSDIIGDCMEPSLTLRDCFKMVADEVAHRVRIDEWYALCHAMDTDWAAGIPDFQNKTASLLLSTFFHDGEKLPVYRQLEIMVERLGWAKDACPDWQAATLSPHSPIIAWGQTPDTLVIYYDEDYRLSPDEITILEHALCLNGGVTGEGSLFFVLDDQVGDDPAWWCENLHKLTGCSFTPRIEGKMILLNPSDPDWTYDIPSCIIGEPDSTAIGLLDKLDAKRIHERLTVVGDTLSDSEAERIVSDCEDCALITM